MSFERISVTRQLINAALKHHFSSDLQLMSTTLACDPSDLSNALTVDGSRKSAIIFERLSSYCITHNLSLDILRDDCIHS